MAGPWIPRQALHSAQLGIRHPGTQLPMTFLAPLPADFLAALAALGLPVPSDSDLAGLQAWVCGQEGQQGGQGQAQAPGGEQQAQQQQTEQRQGPSGG